MCPKSRIDNIGKVPLRGNTASAESESQFEPTRRTPSKILNLGKVPLWGNLYPDESESSYSRSSSAFSEQNRQYRQGDVGNLDVADSESEIESLSCTHKAKLKNIGEVSLRGKIQTR